MTDTAKTYGGALYDLAAGEQLVDEIWRDLQLVCAVFDENPGYGKLLANPAIAKEERRQLIDEAWRGQVHPYTRNFMKLLCDNGTIRQLPDCAAEYKRRYNLDHGILAVRAVCAAPMRPELQEKLPLPYLPKRLAVISSEDAAGFGDFVRHLGDNPYGFRYDCVLVPALMQGEYAAQSIADALWETGKRSSGLDYVLILRGGGADTDLYCYDEYVLASAIAKCPVPVLTAIGHDKDYHIADMVSKMHFKTPTALAEAIISFTAERENEMLSAVACLRLAFSSRIERMQYALELAQSNIENADPRRILRQGYVLARGKGGKVVKKASAATAGDDFSLLFDDGEWACRISEVKLKTKSE